jgi:hypothetical protein
MNICFPVEGLSSVELNELVKFHVYEFPVEGSLLESNFVVALMIDFVIIYRD